MIKPLRILHVSFPGSDGDALFRFHFPAAALANTEGLEVIECDPFHPRFMEFALSCEVLVAPFMDGLEFIPLARRRRKEGLVTVLETNDYYDDIQPWNPIAKHWANPDISWTHKAWIAEADAIQTSSKVLAEHWGSIAKKIAIFENHLPKASPLPNKDPDTLTIGWAGSTGHLADWWWTTGALKPWLDANPSVRLSVMTFGLAKDFIKLSEDRYTFVEFGDYRAYQTFIQSLDIGLAPLLPTEYNRCRSDVKFLEYAANGVLGIYSKFGPYADSIKDGETGLLFESKDQLITALDRAINDRRLRHDIRERAYTKVVSERILADHIGARVEFYRSLLKSEKLEVPNTVGYAPSDSKVLRFASSQQDLELLRGARNIQEIELRCKENPKDLHALIIRSRIYFKQNRIKEGRESFQSALDIFSDGALVHAELARAVLEINLKDEAIKHLIEAIRSDYTLLPLWTLLITLSELPLELTPPETFATQIALCDRCHGKALYTQLSKLIEKAEQITKPLVKAYIQKITENFLLPHVLRVESVQEQHALEKRLLKVFPDSETIAGLRILTMHQNQESPTGLLNALNRPLKAREPSGRPEFGFMITEIAQSVLGLSES